MAANDEMIEYWNDKAGRTWVEEQERMDAMLAPLTSELLAAASGASGERAIDVGCGCGDTTLQLAAACDGVWGVDVSEPMLARAKERAAEAGIGNVAFSKIDAAAAEYTPDHQLIISRFGVMFFDDPTAAFANIRTGLTPDGRIAMIFWQKPTDNPWISTVGAAIRHLLPEPETAPDPRAPGPFAFADRDHVLAMVTGAGYKNISIDPVEADLHMGTDVDDVLHAQTRIGPVARAMTELEGSARDEAFAVARETISSLMTGDGLKLGAAAWILRATAA